MLKNLLSKKSVNEEEFLIELKNNLFNEIKIEQLYKNSDININWTNSNGETMLHLCCKAGYLESVKWLLKNDANIEAKTNDGSTPIFYSIHSKDRAVINHLIENHANVNHLNDFKRTVLQEAVISAQNKFIDLLILNTKNLDNCDVHGNNLIFDAVANGSPEIITKIARLDKVNINQQNLDGNTILHKEVVLKNNELAIKLLEFGADPTIIDKNGKNFLFYAVSKGYKNIELFHKAIQKGCNLNSRSSDNTTILMESIHYFLNTSKEDKEERENHLNMIKELIKLGVNISAVDDNNENAFFIATKSCDEELIDIFLNNSNRININHKNNQGETVLSYLIYRGIENINLIRKYIHASANPNIRDERGRSLIENLIDIILFWQNDIEIDFELEKKINRNGEYMSVLFELLKSTNIDLEQLNSKGQPLFFPTIIYFNFKLFKILNKFNIDINQKDIDGNNIIFKLMENKEPETKDELKIFLGTIQSLINQGVNINTKNNEGQTLLHKAVAEKNEYTVKLLIEAKANIHARDKQGRTILHTAIIKNRNIRFVKLIRHYSKDISDMVDGYGISPLNYAAFMNKKDLVTYFLDEGVLVNNTEKKDPKMLKFFEKFHKNILNLENGIDSELDKVNIRLLIDAMKKEFNIKDE